jgi:hypothetical protein
MYSKLDTTSSGKEGGNPCKEVDPTLMYALRGPQVEPKASYWALCPTLRNVTLDETDPGPTPCYPDISVGQVEPEIKLIRELQGEAHDEAAFTRRLPNLSIFLSDPLYTSRPPVGSVVSKRAGAPFLKYGAELASLFEAETPGLWHRHVLNVLLDQPARAGQNKRRQLISPPRQALMWQALDTAISSALQVIWHYKWIATGLDRVARRRRPYEADASPVLFDFQVEYSGDDIVRNGTLKPLLPDPSPGTPRHPAYGSGHSTYSQAASTVLGCFFPAFATEFQRLADDIGIARLYGGVHWLSDHEFGQLIGRQVGERIIEQLNKSGIEPCMTIVNDPPPRTQLQAEADVFIKTCGHREDGDFCGCPDPEVRLLT